MRATSKTLRIASLTAMLALVMVLLAACGGNGGGNAGGEAAATASPAASPEPSEAAAEEAPAGDRTITYLDQEYTVPAKARRIVITGAMEALEDSLVLDVHPVGAITFGGEFPELFAPITDQAQSIGAKTEPDFETILSLKPDVILATTKFPAEVVEQLQKIGPMIQVSHIASNWQDNLCLLGELTGKQDQAEAEIAAYAEALEGAKSELLTSLEDKKVLAIRVRSGQMYIYPEKVFLNPILYSDLGLTPPAEVTAAKAQEAISMEQLAAINPDYLFLQFASDENTATQTALDELKANPIAQQITAFKNDAVFENVIDPLAEGGPAWSRIHFLQAAKEKLAQ